VSLRGAAVVAACLGGVFGVAGCGGDEPKAPSAAPTVAMYVNATAANYRQVSAGVKLALSEIQGHAGTFRVNYAGEQVSDDPARATADALNNARTSLRDTQVSGVVTALPTEQARLAVTLLNEAGIPTAAVGDSTLKAESCSDRSNMFPSGHRTATVTSPTDAPPASWAEGFRSKLGFAPTPEAYASYLAAKSLLASVATPGVVKPGSNPPRLDRDALGAELVGSHSSC
jgi:uncharacterized membrane protein